MADEVNPSEQEKPEITQRQYYRFYRDNPCNITTDNLLIHATNNDKLHPFVQSTVIKLLYRLKGCENTKLRDFLARQYDIAIAKYLHGFNTFNVNTELLFLQGEVDAVKRTIWLDQPQEEKAIELADAAMYLYNVANTLGVNLDEAIFYRLLNLEKEKYSSDIE